MLILSSGISSENDGSLSAGRLIFRDGRRMAKGNANLHRLNRIPVD